MAAELTTKKCKHCFSEIDGRATVCPSCGRRLYSNGPLYLIIGAAVVLFVLLVCALAVIFIVGSIAG